MSEKQRIQDHIREKALSLRFVCICVLIAALHQALCIFTVIQKDSETQPNHYGLVSRSDISAPGLPTYAYCAVGLVWHTHALNEHKHYKRRLQGPVKAQIDALPSLRKPFKPQNDAIIRP